MTYSEYEIHGVEQMSLDEKLAAAAAARSAAEKEMQAAKKKLIEAVLIHKDLLARQQIIARHKEAGALLLETLPPAEAAAKLAELRASGQIKDTGIVLTAK